MRFVIVGGFWIEVDGGTELGMWRAQMLDGLLWFWRERDWVVLFRYCCVFVHVMKKATVPVQKCPATVFGTLFILFKINRVITKSSSQTPSYEEIIPKSVFTAITLPATSMPYCNPFPIIRGYSLAS